MKRFFDVIFSFLGIVLLLPVFIIIAILIKVYSKSSVFYIQKRVGKGNRDFYLYKFRTMTANASEQGYLTVGTRDDRITRIGYYLRKYKLDELPQLLNVLKGDMSLVGPRPEVRQYVDLYTPEQKEVLLVKPGITDYASIEYSNESELLGKAGNSHEAYITQIMPAKLKLNLKYIAEQSLLTDIKIIFNTMHRILK
ncbi:sugar transferase [bacterium AH-315-M05]|nr:sugar transferase [bacterium AH-315-M05]